MKWLYILQKRGSNICVQPTLSLEQWMDLHFQQTLEYSRGMSSRALGCVHIDPWSKCLPHEAIMSATLTPLLPHPITKHLIIPSHSTWEMAFQFSKLFMRCLKVKGSYNFLMDYSFCSLCGWPLGFYTHIKCMSNKTAVSPSFFWIILLPNLSLFFHFQQLLYHFVGESQIQFDLLFLENKYDSPAFQVKPLFLTRNKARASKGLQDMKLLPSVLFLHWYYWKSSLPESLDLVHKSWASLLKPDEQLIACEVGFPAWPPLKCVLLGFCGLRHTCFCMPISPHALFFTRKPT